MRGYGKTGEGTGRVQLSEGTEGPEETEGTEGTGRVQLLEGPEGPEELRGYGGYERVQKRVRGSGPYPCTLPGPSEGTGPYPLSWDVCVF